MMIAVTRAVVHQVVRDDTETFFTHPLVQGQVPTTVITYSMQIKHDTSQRVVMWWVERIVEELMAAEALELAFKVA